MGRLQCSPYSSEYRPDLANNKLEFALFAKVIQRWLLAEQSVTAKCLPLLLVVLFVRSGRWTRRTGFGCEGTRKLTESGHQVSLISKAFSALAQAKWAKRKAELVEAIQQFEKRMTGIDERLKTTPSRWTTR